MIPCYEGQCWMYNTHVMWVFLSYPLLPTCIYKYTDIYICIAYKFNVPSLLLSAFVSAFCLTIPVAHSAFSLT